MWSFTTQAGVSESLPVGDQLGLQALLPAYWWGEAEGHRPPEPCRGLSGGPPPPFLCVTRIRFLSLGKFAFSRVSCKCNHTVT